MRRRDFFTILGDRGVTAGFNHLQPRASLLGLFLLQPWGPP